ncbi:MAG: hypothetical protein RIC52_12200 [Amphiplicatus sp.]
MRFFAALAALAVFVSAEAASADRRTQTKPALGIGDAAWLAPDADRVAFLIQTPGECLRNPENGDQRFLVEVGRAAFRSPLLLGGQAARGGLSCNACHRDGRDNPDFFLEGLSETPGTADVTSSLFSKTRDDGVFNPLPIPSLVDTGGKAMFGERAQAASLHAFISGAVVEEFQGAAPHGTIVAGLAAYISHLGSDACPDGPTSASVLRDMQAAARALAAAETALGRGDAATADFLLLAAQRELRSVHERFEASSKARSKLESLARDIGAIRPLAGERVGEAEALVAEKRAQTQELARFLHKRRAKSLYDRTALERRLAEP